MMSISLKSSLGNQYPEIIDEKVLTAGGVTYINKTIGFHQVLNPSETNSASTLHCYNPPYDVTESFDENGKMFEQVLLYYTEAGNLVNSSKRNA